jgi:hypothetical protein
MRRGSTLLFIALIPTVLASLTVLVVEPLPHHWLSPSNPHFAANLLRAFVFFLGGSVIGLVSYVMVKATVAEATVTGGHPRRKLYRHVSAISFGHGILMVALLFFVRERINNPLSPATPVVLVGFAATLYALREMLGYQNSRLREFHAAKQVFAFIEPAEEDGQHHLCLRAVGSTESMSIERWVEEFQGGKLCRMTIEKVEELGQPSDGGRRRWWRRA